MSARARLACLVRGHSWTEERDPAGTMTYCSRCGKLRHERLDPNRQLPPELGPGGGGDGGGGD